MSCPANGCTVDVDPAMLMCPRHWYMVPKDLRLEVWRTWKARLKDLDLPAAKRNRESVDRHEHAKAAAIKAVNERLAS